MTSISNFKSDNANLDVIRAVAVMSVFFSHLSGTLLGPSELAWHFGQMGVLIFFVHTSMVLMLSLERSNRDARSLVTDFYLRRGFRIYPLAIVCVTIAFVFQAQRSWPQYLSNLTLTQNLTFMPDMVRGLWSLPLEVQMYLVLPFLFLSLRAASIRWTLGAWLLAVLLAVIQPAVSARLGVIGFAPCFLGGVLAWRLSRRYVPLLSGRWWPVVFVATWTIWLVASREHHMYYRWVFCLGLGAVIPWFTEIPWRPVRVASHQIATYSYGIYLSHFAIIEFCFVRFADRPAWFRWALFAMLATAIPIALFHLIERPMINAGRRVTEHWHRQPAAGAASVTVSALS